MSTVPAVVKSSTLPRLRLTQEERLATNTYPKELVQAFHAGNTFFSRLPVLDLNGRIGTNGYIDFIEPQDMTHSVMRFTDSYQRPGIAIKIQARREIPPSRFLKPVPGNTFVLALFRRYTHPDSIWTYAWGNSDQRIETLYEQRHVENEHGGLLISECPTCPFVAKRIPRGVFPRLLNGEDPDFVLPRNNTAVDNTAVEGRRLSLRSRIIISALCTITIAYLFNRIFYRGQRL